MSKKNRKPKQFSGNFANTEKSSFMSQLERLAQSNKIMPEPVFGTGSTTSTESVVDLANLYASPLQVKFLGRPIHPIDFDPGYFAAREKYYQSLSRTIMNDPNLEARDKYSVYANASLDLLWRMGYEAATGVTGAGLSADKVAGTVLAAFEAELIYIQRDLEYLLRTFQMFMLCIGSGAGSAAVAYANKAKLDNMLLTGLMNLPWCPQLSNMIAKHMKTSFRNSNYTSAGKTMKFMRLPIPLYGHFNKDWAVPQHMSSRDYGTDPAFNPAVDTVEHIRTVPIYSPALQASGNIIAPVLWERGKGTGKANYKDPYQGYYEEATRNGYQTNAYFEQMLTDIQILMARYRRLWGMGEAGEQANAGNPYFAALHVTTNEMLTILSLPSSNLFTGTFKHSDIQDSTAYNVLDPADDVEVVKREMTYMSHVQPVRNVAWTAVLGSTSEGFASYLPDAGRLFFGAEDIVKPKTATALKIVPPRTRLLLYYKNLAVKVKGREVLDADHENVLAPKIDPAAIIMARPVVGDSMPEIGVTGLSAKVFNATGAVDTTLGNQALRSMVNGTAFEDQDGVRNKLFGADVSSVYVYNPNQVTLPAPFTQWASGQWDSEDVPHLGEYQMLLLSADKVTMWANDAAEITRDWGQGFEVGKVFTTEDDMALIKPTFIQSVQKPDLSVDSDPTNYGVWMPRSRVLYETPVYDMRYCIDYEIDSSHPRGSYTLVRNIANLANKKPVMMLRPYNSIFTKLNYIFKDETGVEKYDDPANHKSMIAAPDSDSTTVMPNYFVAPCNWWNYSQGHMLIAYLNYTMMMYPEGFTEEAVWRNADGINLVFRIYPYANVLLWNQHPLAKSLPYLPNILDVDEKVNMERLTRLRYRTQMARITGIFFEDIGRCKAFYIQHRLAHMRTSQPLYEEWFNSRKGKTLDDIVDARRIPINVDVLAQGIDVYEQKKYYRTQQTEQRAGRWKSKNYSPKDKFKSKEVKETVETTNDSTNQSTPVDGLVPNVGNKIIKPSDGV